MKDLCNKAKSAKKRQSTSLSLDFIEFSRPQIVFLDDRIDTLSSSSNVMLNETSWVDKARENLLLNQDLLLSISKSEKWYIYLSSVYYTAEVKVFYFTISNSNESRYAVKYLFFKHSPMTIKRAYLLR